MLLRYFNGPKSSRELEFEIWREVNLVGVPGCDPYSLALALYRRGLAARIFVKGETMPDRKLIERRFGKGSAELTRFALNQSMKKVRELGLEIIKRLPSTKEIRDALKSNTVPVFMVYMHSAPHWIVIKGVYRGGYVINDPYHARGGKNIRLSLKKFEQAANNLKKRVRINPNCFFVWSR